MIDVQDWETRLSVTAGDRLKVTTAQRIAELLRDRIMEGALRPGLQLSEEALSQTLEVSRNTLREAFRLLAQRRLVTHSVGRGVFVSSLSAESVADLYFTRKIVECSSLAHRAANTQAAFDVLEKSMAAIDSAAASEDWLSVGTADLIFHRAIVQFSGSPRLDEMISQMLAECRLAFHSFPDLGEFHGRYIARNRKLLSDIRKKNFDAAIDRLGVYLDDVRDDIVTQMRKSPANKKSA